MKLSIAYICNYISGIKLLVTLSHRCNAFLKKMRNSIKVLFLLLVLGISSCSSSFIVRTKNQNIKLNPLDEKGIIIGLENELVIIKFNQNELIHLFEKDIAEFYEERIAELIYEMATFKTDKIFNEKELKGTIPFMEYELKFQELLQSGNTEIVWKESKIKLKKIKYKYTRDKLGGEKAYYYKNDGTEFYNITLALGE